MATIEHTFYTLEMAPERLFELRRTTFDTPQFRGITFIESEAKTVINHVPGNYLPFKWTINPYRGCSHACVMCFARSTHTYMDMDAGRDFETKIVVKVNAPEVLRGQLRSKRWKGEHIAMGTATDPYQRAEGRYKLMRGILQALIDYRNPFSILTKGTLMLRDLDLLLEAAEVTDVSTAYSIATFDEGAWRKAEPGTPHPRKRMEAVKKLNEAGIPCGVMVAAVLPGINDGVDQLKEVVHAAVDAGATHVTPILLHLRPKVKEVYMEWLGENYPHLVDRYEAMYGRSAYASNAQREQLSRQVGEILDSTPKPPARRWASKSNRRSRPAEQPRDPNSEQLSLI